MWLCYVVLLQEITKTFGDYLRHYSHSQLFQFATLFSDDSQNSTHSCLCKFELIILLLTVIFY